MQNLLPRNLVKKDWIFLSGWFKVPVVSMKGEGGKIQIMNNELLFSSIFFFYSRLNKNPEEEEEAHNYCCQGGGGERGFGFIW